MDGLEAVEVMLSNILKANDYFRLEAEYFSAGQFNFKNTLSGENTAKLIQYGTSDALNEEGRGHPILRLNEFDSMFIKTPSKYCDSLSSFEYESLRINRGDVLVCRTNGNPDLVGKAAVVMEDMPYAFASYLFKVNVNEIILPEVLATFLNCSFGRMEIDKNSMKGNQTNFSPAKFKDIKVPIFNAILQKMIAEIVEKSYQLQKRSKAIYISAEQMLLDALSMDDFVPTTENISIKSLSKSFSFSGRLDAEYYQPKYKDIQDMLLTEETVGSTCNLHDKNYNPIDNQIYKYIELANVGAIGHISGVKTILGAELPTRARRMTKKGQVIVSSIEGSLQSCALITEEYDKALCSTGFYVVDSCYINSETLLVLFKSAPIQALLKQRCSGTILTGITKDDFLGMPFPKIEPKAQDKIAHKIQEFSTLRKQSETLLTQAKQAVEMAIEQDEEKAMQWLKSIEEGDDVVVKL